MAGRAKIMPSDTLANDHILLLSKKGVWQIAKAPVHDDGKLSGLGPGLSFARSLLEKQRDTSLYIGLIPTARSGSSINSWLPASDSTPSRPYYKRAVLMAKKAMKVGTLKAILWQQGETDCTAEGARTYGQKLKTLVAGFRKDLGCTELPFFAGLLPAFQHQRPDKDSINFSLYVDPMNAIIQGLDKLVSNYFIISSENTSDRGDHLHFNTESARLMGRRYAAAVDSLIMR